MTSPDKASVRLHLTMQNASRSTGRPTMAKLRRWLRAALTRHATITVRFVDRPEGQRLNHTYRHKDYPTNVLTFPYHFDSTDVVGDLVLCAPVVREEARRQHKALEHHYAHLIVHGALHLQGYDHEEESEANIMEHRESEILACFAIPNPYGETLHG